MALIGRTQFIAGKIVQVLSNFVASSNQDPTSSLFSAYSESFPVLRLEYDPFQSDKDIDNRQAVKGESNTYTYITIHICTLKKIQHTTRQSFPGLLETLQHG